MEFMHGALERDKREGVSQRNESEEGLVVILRQASTLHYFVCLFVYFTNPGFYLSLFLKQRIIQTSN